MTRGELIELMTRDIEMAIIRDDNPTKLIGAVLAAIEAHGLAVVPEEATDTMVEAGLDSLNEGGVGRVIDRDPYLCHRAMIAAGRI